MLIRYLIVKEDKTLESYGLNAGKPQQRLYFSNSFNTLTQLNPSQFALIWDASSLGRLMPTNSSALAMDLRYAGCTVMK